MFCAQILSHEYFNIYDKLNGALNHGIVMVLWVVLNIRIMTYHVDLMVFSGSPGHPPYVFTARISDGGVNPLGIPSFF